VKFKQFTTPPGTGCKPLTLEQAQSFLTDADISLGMKRGDLKTFGPWQLPVSYTALATSCDFAAEGRPLTVYGLRTLTKVNQSGHELEGRVSINGKSYRGFTSSQLFELPDGRLVSVAIIHVCMGGAK
jgi:hypothetical protein